MALLEFAAMSGSRSLHLQRRNGIFHLRLRVPDAIRLRVERTEIVRSLKTYSVHHARLRAALTAAKLTKVFKMIAVNEFNANDARSLINECFVGLTEDMDKVVGFIPSSTDVWHEIEDQRQMSLEFISELETKRISRIFSGDAISKADALLATRGMSLSDLPKPRQIDLLDGVVRALVEEQRLFMHRLDDRLTPYEPTDVLFRQKHSALKYVPKDAVVEPQGLTIAKAVAEYLEAHRQSWRQRTYNGRVWQTGYLVEFLGADRKIVTVTTDDIRNFKNRIQSLRANHGRSAHQSFAEKQTPNVKARIAGKTATVIFEPTKAFFRWAKSEEGLIAINPAEDIRIVVEKKPKGYRARRPFDPAETTQLFSSPLFTGCKSSHRRFTPGDQHIRDAKFWVPIIGFYTGMRLAEIVQLHIRDVSLDGPVPFFDINENNAAGADEKHVKSDAGVRKVPIHPDILALGFAEFCKKRSKYVKPTTRLFSEVKYGSDGSASTEFSKFFARLMDRVGLPDPKLTFHSFRHGFSDALRNADVPPYTIDKITGHSDGSVSSQYGSGNSLAVCHKAILDMVLPARLPIIIENSQDIEKLEKVQIGNRCN